MKVVTICGSMKFKDKMMEVARDLEIKNKYVVIQCVYGNDKFNEEEQVLLAELHYKKIDISDAIYVVNVDGYIGTSTKKAAFNDFTQENDVIAVFFDGNAVVVDTV